MDWNIFWAAFGAIGTTLGSLITASAVVIAVKQYKQPLKKIVKVEVTSAITVDYLENSLMFFCIKIMNRGVRTVEVNSINIQGNKKVLWINKTQYESNTKINLPAKIEPEEIIDFFIEVEKFRRMIKKAVTNKVIRKRGKLVVFVTDSLGDKYYCKTNIKIASLINSL